MKIRKILLTLCILGFLLVTTQPTGIVYPYGGQNGDVPIGQPTM